MRLLPRWGRFSVLHDFIKQRTGKGLPHRKHSPAFLARLP
jgi:hypothetical protein